jgi:hypothetical protein
MTLRRTTMTGADWTGNPADADLTIDVTEQPVFADWPREQEQISPFGSSTADDDGRVLPLEVVRIRVKPPEPLGPWLDWHWRSGEQRYMVVVDDPSTPPAQVSATYEAGLRLVGVIRAKRGAGRPSASTDELARFWRDFSMAVKAWRDPEGKEPDAISIAADMGFYTRVTDGKSRRRRRGTDDDANALPAGSTLRSRLQAWYGLDWEEAVAKARLP